MPSNCGAREDSWESLGQQGDQTSQSQSNSTLNIHWKDWCWSWNFSFLVIWCEQTTHWKSSWCWERLRAEGEEGVRGWDGCTASPMQQTWTWANSRGWWGTGRTGVLQSRDWTQVSCTVGRRFTIWTTREVLEKQQGRGQTFSELPYLPKDKFSKRNSNVVNPLPGNFIITEEETGC